MKTININGSDYTVEELSKILEDAKKLSPMDKVYEYHSTTEEEFNKLYQSIPNHVKAYQKECMIVAYYNKGWIPNFKDKNERKYYLWLYLDEFRLDCANYGYGLSSSSARLLFKSEKEALEASELFFEVFKESRMFNQ